MRWPEKPPVALGDQWAAWFWAASLMACVGIYGAPSGQPSYTPIFQTANLQSGLPGEICN